MSDNTCRQVLFLLLGNLPKWGSLVSLAFKMLTGMKSALKDLTRQTNTEVSDPKHLEFLLARHTFGPSTLLVEVLCEFEASPA